MTNETISFGRPIDFQRLGNLEPEEVLFDYEGPRIFTTRSSDGDLLLAYSYITEVAGDLYLVVPFSEEKVSDLKLGHCTLRDALSQAWTWIARVSQDGDVVAANSVAIESLPHNSLPQPGIYLWPDLQPLFSVKLLGPNLKPGMIPASVVKLGVDQAYRALKALVERALKVTGTQGRPEERLRRHYDLPTQRLAFGSLEIAFGTPLKDDQYAVDFDHGTPKSQDLQVQTEVSALLEKGATWLKTGLEVIQATTIAPQQEQDDRQAILTALSNLAPPSKGLVERVEVSGRLVNSSRAVISLTRKDTVLIKMARQTLPSSDEAIIKEGFVRELDLDKQSFTLRSEPEGGVDLLRGWVGDELFEDAQAAFNFGGKVRVVGVRTSGGEVEVQRLDPLIETQHLSAPK